MSSCEANQTGQRHTLLYVPCLEQAEEDRDG